MQAYNNIYFISTFLLTLTNKIYIMKHILTKSLEALLILLSIFILGIFIPFITSLFIVFLTDTTLSECITTVPFWLFSLLGWILSSLYLNDVVKNKQNKLLTD